MISSADAMFRQAISAMQARDIAAAEQAFRGVLQLQPRHVGALNLFAVLLISLGRFEEAERYARLALDEDATSDVTLYNYGLILKALKRPAEALERFNQALKINPSIASTWNNRGTVFNDLRRYDDAVGDFDRAIQLDPQYAEAYFNKGKSFTLLKRLDDASSAFERALALRPNLAEAWLGRGNVFCKRKQYTDAFAAYDRALSLKAELAEGWLGRGNAFQEVRRYQEALAAFERAATLKPDLIEAWIGSGEMLARLKRHEEAARAYARVLEIDPQRPFMKGNLLHQKMSACAWNGVGDLIAEIDRDVSSGKLSAEPFGWQGVAKSPRNLQRCAELFNAEKYPARAGQGPRRSLSDRGKIRIGYASGEFRDQATSHLIVGVLERHDKSRFEIVGFDNGWNDGSDIRRRIEAAVPEIIDVTRLTDEAAAAAIRDRRIDILVNLNGYFGEGRTGVFAQRPAPIQVNYLGFPGTLGAPYIDYIVADRCVIPPGDEAFYEEKVVYLPDCYQANDDRKTIAARTFSRAECGLPQHGFVFCCFNNSYKITPEVFDCWMGILKVVPGSVLWLIEDSAGAVSNLRREALARAVDPDRLVFAGRMRLADHLARHRLADLFLDTLPYNAHTTASDALWAGLPVLTQMGGTFPGRVAASLLQAIGLAELIAPTQDAYRELAIALASDPQRLAAIKDTLARNRLAKPLFDTQRLTRHVEAAYTTMWDIYQRGEGPRSFGVAPE
ncbi:MAG TPA: tetratricopeptide repeat protein [Xanthobacteraceae bacterium]|nr:tetratricopeptide repeat protein [Xanthobacteraceae bacterium]